MAENGARHVTENEANFRTIYIGMLAERVARDFYPFDWPKFQQGRTALGELILTAASYSASARAARAAAASPAAPAAAWRCCCCWRPAWAAAWASDRCSCLSISSRAADLSSRLRPPRECPVVFDDAIEIDPARSASLT